jgi:transposase
MKACKDFDAVYLHREPVDMRKGINGLCDVVASCAMGELQGKNLFVFTGRRRGLMKILYFDETGFAVWMKRLEKDNFPWPKKLTEDVIGLTPQQLEWLLQGYDVWRLKSFKKVSFEKVA